MHALSRGEDVGTVFNQTLLEGAEDGFALVTTRTELRWRGPET